MLVSILALLWLSTLALQAVEAGTTIREQLTVGGTQREYVSYVPSALGSKRPLLISCHGMNQDANYQKDMLKVETVADTAKFVTVFPEGINKGWDISGNSDLNFLLKIIDVMVEKYDIDPGRVYLSGFSMGGMLTYHAMNKLADRIAAFAPISGYTMGGVTASASVRPIPIIHTHGTGDDVVTFSNVQNGLNAWIQHNECPTTAKVTNAYRNARHITRRVWGPGKEGVEVVLMELADKGHWISNDVVLTVDEIWKFCSRYRIDVAWPVQETGLEPDVKFSNLADLKGNTFAIVNTDTQKALYGSSAQNLAFDDWKTAFSDANAGYQFRLENSSVADGYLLRLVTPDGADYNIWGNPGYLNTQTADQWCCFILGLNNQNGQDLQNGAVWNIQYTEGKGFTLKNVGTGKYLHDASPAKYNDPAYFQFCTLKPIGTETQYKNRDTIDISGNNSSSDYKTYDAPLSIPSTKTVDVLMARYCYFTSTIGGTGVLNLHAGGERCYLGTAKGAQWPDWSGFSGEVHVWPFTENAKAGFYGVILAHGGKVFSAENIEDCIRTGKVNASMANNKVVLHAGATLSCEANKNGSGFRLGELQTEEGSNIIGYMKKDTRAAYFLVGSLNTDATLAGTIEPNGGSDTHPVGLIKEGTGTYRITGNNNYLTGALRVLEGQVLVQNDVAETAAKKLRGALGAKPNPDDAIAYVFEAGLLGGTGSIGGTVDNYGTLAPGSETPGVLTLKNYAAAKDANLYVRPESRLRFKVASSTLSDQLVVDGKVTYWNVKQDFSTSTKMPCIEIVPAEDANLEVGNEFVLLQAKAKASKSASWNFKFITPSRYTWTLEEREEEGVYQVVARVISLDNQPVDDDPTADDPTTESGLGAFYDDGIDEATDFTTLREYAAKHGKRIGTAISMWKNDLNNAALPETQEVAAQFNMLVAENEMKFDALQPAQNSFNFGSADQLIDFAERNQMAVRGHCLAWYNQLPTWVSSDGKKNDKNWSRAEALKILENHITQVVTHFKGRVAEWDVVNECLDDDQTAVRTNPDGYDLRRECVWTKAIGEDYIDSAFVYAHRADPEAKLYLNDYDVELQGKAKSVAFYNLAVRLKKAGIPIHGVGLQCHFSVGDVDSLKLAQTFSRFAEVGLECIVTELDMGIASATDDLLEEQARNYRVITDIVLNNEHCPNLVIWGLKDNNSWREASSPLLYTSGLSRKPAWYAVRSALRHRTLSTSPNALESVQAPTGRSEFFDVLGRRVQSPGTGLYIVNGKVLLVR